MGEEGRKGKQREGGKGDSTGGNGRRAEGNKEEGFKCIYFYFLLTKRIKY